jgi:glycosyltransferase involved in cell wall biosynthesis
MLPVRNAQAILQTNVQRLLDVLPELSGRFEVLIVDDGSTDATCEIAYELARAFPQIKVARQTAAIGWAATVAKHASQAAGEFLMIHGGGEVAADEIVSLWRLRSNIMVPASVGKSPAPKSWRVDAEAKQATGASAEKLQITPLLNGVCIHARAPKSNILLIKRQQLNRLESALAAVPKTPSLGTPVKTKANSQDAQRAPGLKSPSFLSHIKNFALGE